MPTVRSCLWFDHQAEEAANFYVTLLPNSRVVDVSRYGEGMPVPADTALTVNFELGGAPFMGLNGGPQFRLDEAFSIFVNADGQAEVDRLWDALAEGGGEPGQCGWIRDRFGVWWQVVPTILGSILGDPDPVKAQRAMQAMLAMSKLDIATLEAARDGR